LKASVIFEICSTREGVATFDVLYRSELYFCVRLI